VQSNEFVVSGNQRVAGQVAEQSLTSGVEVGCRGGGTGATSGVSFARNYGGRPGRRAGSSVMPSSVGKPAYLFEESHRLDW